MKNTMNLIEQEEHYQFLRMILDQMSPKQRESTIDLFKTFCRMPKKQINMLSSLIDRYRLEDHAAENIETDNAAEISEADVIYSILEDLAAKEGIKVEYTDIEKELGPGYAVLYRGGENQEIRLDNRLYGQWLNQEFAIALAYSRIMSAGGYGNMITCKNQNRVSRFQKQAKSIARMILMSISAGLSARQ